MKREQERPLGDDVATRVDQARLARQWSGVSAGLASRPRRRFFFAALAPAAIVALAMIAVLIARPWRSDASSGVARATDAVVLPDGSRMTLSSGAEVVLETATPTRVHLTLGAGTLDLDVTHVEGRPFVVTAGGHDVTVLGTAFMVKLEARDGKRTLSVDVTRGRVRVFGPTGDHILDAGQSWSARIDALASGASASGVGSPSALAASPSVPPVLTTPEGQATVDPPAPSAEPVALPAPTTAPPVEGPRELLARATDARAAGRPRDAAVALDTLRKRYRSDARAGLAAFELGRLRMDALSDPAGAAEAFGDAMALAPAAPFREDAEARRVEALDALPDRARCERARDAFIARYPAGLHANNVLKRCKRP